MGKCPTKQSISCISSETIRSICACAISSASRSRLTRRSPNTFPKTVRNDVPPVFGMCRNSTGFAVDGTLASTRFGESLLAKDPEFIAVQLLFYSQNSVATAYNPSICTIRHQQQSVTPVRAGLAYFRRRSLDRYNLGRESC